MLSRSTLPTLTILVLLAAASLPSPAAAQSAAMAEADETQLILSGPMNAYVKAHIVQDACNAKVSEDENTLGEEILNIIGAINEDFCGVLGRAFVRAPSKHLTQMRQSRDRLQNKYGKVNSSRKRALVRNRVINISERALSLENVIRIHSGLETRDSEQLIFIVGPGSSDEVIITDRHNLSEFAAAD